ncbi:MAG: hypothetical protein U0R19_25860 [Bryobacteraceae bacterium]
MKTPYDGRFKLLAEEFPHLLLRLLGIVEPGCSPAPIDILRELHLEAVQVDHVYRIGEDRMVHFEAITGWHASRVPRLALYRFLMKEKYGLPVSSYLVLMSEKYAPRTLPAKITYAEADGFRIEAPYHVVKLWEIDPAIAFEPGCEPLLPWVPLLKGGEAEFAEAALAIEKLAECRDQVPYPVEAMVSNLAGLAALRYDKDEIRRFLKKLQERIKMTSDLFTETWLYQDGKSEGRNEGKAEGRNEGRTEATLKALRTVFELRFPHAVFPSLETGFDPEALEAALRAVVQAPTAEVALTSIRVELGLTG